MNRGVRPWLDTQPAAVRRPVRESAEKIAMLSWPRFEQYTNRPPPETAISAPVLSPV